MRKEPALVPHLGEVSIKVGGALETVRFDWAALSRLHAKYGKEWQASVRDAVLASDTLALADILACASERDAAWWLEVSPPVVETSTAIQLAIEAAFLGPDRASAANPLMRLRSLLKI